ncbi:MAG: hypothetical protein LKJ22_10080 [Liquorilactobacillus nagelii]|uniref:hypothetical protein n=1 Tax=Liquorilactobacillus nagelii TaxID=82688 RepID=UPI001CCD8637|nr:hypothetical protein [Liquorilactobacillus nagelii]MCI1634349.1 hypothetical protein [Liquorilactobacillus nagelii]MCI1922249.1 hypothetical protein [Liquorilactobacillus nagelii]MCI1977376.1 hypothetical protein [Liquorilactobacillus nagelii]ULQ49890.1 hypothetical protein J6864_02295 [Liquorilactobacillus nagelii]
MFLTTGDVNRSYVILGIVNATVKRTLLADEIDELAEYDELYNEVKTKLVDRAVTKNGDGLLQVRFVPQIVQVGPGPKYMLLHGYGTAVRFPSKK